MTRHLHIDRLVATQENRCVVDLRPNLNNQLVEAEWVQKEVGRHSRLSSLRDRAANLRRRLASSSVNPGRVVKAFCLAVAVFCIVYFPLRLIVGAVS